MSANSFGNIFKITTFGESHGPALGVVIEGCPAGVYFDLDLLIYELKRRKPNQQTYQNESLTTSRDEADNPEILSGVFEGRTLGTPICVMVKNSDTRSQDYASVKLQPRSGHADEVWKNKFSHVDYRGGGRSSGRETVSRVIAGSVAQMYLNSINCDVKVRSWISQIGEFKLTKEERKMFLESENISDSYPCRFPSSSIDIQKILLSAKSEGNSYGGLGSLIISNVPSGLGQPIFKKLKAELANAIFSIGAVSGVEIGAGFMSSSQDGVTFHKSEESVENYGGILGGIATGRDININFSVKPTSSILDIAKAGRHDPCILIRMIPVVESMVKLVLVDHLLWAKLDKI